MSPPGKKGGETVKESVVKAILSTPPRTAASSNLSRTGLEKFLRKRDLMSLWVSSPPPPWDRRMRSIWVILNPMKTVDVSGKIETFRRASARGRIRLRPQTVRLIREKALPKGDLVSATQLTGVFSAKRVGDLLPFCHPVTVDFVEVQVKVNDEYVEVRATVGGVGRTGYEMEALTAVSAALLNVYDMCKGVDSTMVIEEIRLTEKSGGKSDWERDLSGVRVNVLSPREDLREIAVGYLRKLSAEISRDAHLLLIIGEPYALKERISAFESVVAFYDFRRDPTGAGSEIRIGRDREGRLVVLIPESEEKLRFFFETFGGVLRSLL